MIINQVLYLVTMSTGCRLKGKEEGYLLVQRRDTTLPSKNEKRANEEHRQEVKTINRKRRNDSMRNGNEERFRVVPFQNKIIGMASKFTWILTS